MSFSDNFIDKTFCTKITGLNSILKNKDILNFSWSMNQNLINKTTSHHPGITNDNEGKVDKKDVSQWDQFENAGVAFLGPQLWEKTIPCDSDLKLEYMDLDEFLNAKNIDDELLKRTMGGLTSSSPAHANAPHPHPHPHPETPTTHSSEQSTDLSLLATNLAIGISHESSSPNSSKSSCSSPTDRNQGVDYPSSLKSDSKSPMSPSSSVSDYKEDFDPRTHTFSEDELKPQPMTKKSQKQYIPHEMKDDRYWQRRRKNNMAAKRSRDARRMKENQIALRACYLEKENNNLRSELDKTRTMLEVMKKRLATYESTE